MVDNNTSMIEVSYNSDDSQDLLSSIHNNSNEAIGIKDLDSGSQQNLSFEHVPKKEQTFIKGKSSRKLSPPQSYIPPMPGSAGMSRNNLIIDKKDSDIGSQAQYYHVPQSMVDLSMTRQSIQLRQEQDQLHYMMKQVRDEKAQIVKQLAIIEQQCELLKLQLQEAHQRERTQSQMSERLQSALKQQVTAAELKLMNQESSIVEVDADHPQVKQILQFHLGQAQDKLHAERETFHQKIYQLEREVQKAKHETQNCLRDQTSQKQDFEQKLRSLEQDLKRQESAKQDEFRNLKDRLQDRIKNLENEIEHLRAEEQTERYALLNKHIEQAAYLNNQIKKLGRENQELQNQAKKVEIQRDLESEAKQYLQKEIDMRQDDITDLEQALQETQFQLQRLDQTCKAEIMKGQEEIERLLELNQQFQERAQTKDNFLKKSQLNSTQKSSYRDGSSGRSVSKTNDYFLTTASAIKRQELKSNRSLSQKKVNQSQDVRDMSYTRMCKELEESLIVPDDNAEKLVKLQQLVAHFRSISKRLEVQYKDLKVKYQQDVESLQSTIKTEKRRRAAVYEEKMERSNQLLQQIGEKDTIIFQLTKKVSALGMYSGLQQTMMQGTFNSVPTSEYISEYTSNHQTATKEPIKRDLQNKRRSTILQRSFTNAEPGFTEQPISRKDTKPLFQMKGQTKAKRVIVKKLIRPAQVEIPVLRLDQSSNSPYYMSEGSTTRLPITSTEKKLILKDDLPSNLQAQLSSRNERVQQDSSEIVNYETQQVSGLQAPEVSDKEISEISLENEYYRVDNPPDNTHLDKIQTLVQQNNVMLDMQNIFGSDSSEKGPNPNPNTRQQLDLKGVGPDLQNSLMSIAKMRYVDTQSNDRDRADSLESATQNQKPLVITKPITRFASTHQLPRRTSVCSLNGDKQLKKKNQPNIPPKPVTISKKSPTPIIQNLSRVSPTLKKSTSQKPPK